VELKTDPQIMGALGAAEYARQKGGVQNRVPAAAAQEA
jgi:hypothetical protein